jgi:NitT/TauT family transport system substrate-binding protein
MLQWLPQSQFAGYYVAKEKGMYSRRGLDVEILRGGPDRDPVRHLKDGKADFVLLWLASALDAMDQGVPLAHVAQIVKRSNLEIVAWADKGIRSVKDLEGRRASIWEEPFRPAFQAFFKAQGVRPQIVPQYSTVNLFLRHGVDACSVMEYNEHHLLYQAGIDESQIVRFPLFEQGTNFPEDGIYCLAATRDSTPEVCKALAEATLEGWREAADHPDEALDAVMARVAEEKLATNRTHMRWMLDHLIPSIFPKEEGEWKPGVLPRESYDETKRWLVELDVIKGAPPYEEFVK